jgi:hypothetical protein
MDWHATIARNRTALLAVATAIVALIGGRDGPARIAPALRAAAFALLRPAESALRRLIIMAARGLVVTLGAPRPLLQRPAGHGNRTPAFPLFDRDIRFRPMRRVRRAMTPRIRTFWGPALPPPPPPVLTPMPNAGAPVDASRLHRRLGALEAALADLPRQARRLARWRAKIAANLAARCAARSDIRRRTPMRIGRPPGHRQDAGRDVDRVLRECHALALETWDTS